jgi:hypothetical protein
LNEIAPGRWVFGRRRIIRAWLSPEETDRQVMKCWAGGSLNTTLFYSYSQLVDRDSRNEAIMDAFPKIPGLVERREVAKSLDAILCSPQTRRRSSLGHHKSYVIN